MTTLRARALAVPAALLALTAAAAPAVAAEPPPPRWRVPETLTTSEYGVNGLAAAGSARGGEVLLWGGNRASSTVLVSQRAAGARAWSAPRPLADGCRTGEVAPIVAASNDAGDVVAAWSCVDLTPTATTYRLQAARRPAGGSWEPAVTVVPAMAVAPVMDLAVTAAGDAVLMVSVTGVGVGVAEQPAGGAWSEPRTLATLPPFATGDVDLALRPDGSGGAAWLSGTAPASTIALARRSADGSWSAAETASTGARAYYPAVAAPDDGSLVVAWTDGTLGPGVAARARAADGTWSETATLGRGYAPRLDAAAGGRTVITWSDGGYPRQSVRVASHRTGAAWVQAGRLPTSISDQRRGWDVDVDRRGDVLIGAVDRAPAVQVARLGASATTLGPATTLSNPSQVRPGGVAVAARPDGQATVAWSGFVPPGALGLKRGGTALQAVDLARRSSRPPLVTRTVLGRIDAGKVRVAEHALLRLNPTFRRYAGPVRVVVQRLLAKRWRTVGRAVARNEDAMALRLTGPGAARLRLVYRSGGRTLYAPVAGVRVTRPANRRIPAGAYPGEAVVAGRVLWTVGVEAGTGRSVVRAFDARSGRRLLAPFTVAPSRLLAVGDRAWLTTPGSPEVTPLDVAAPGGRRPPITLPGVPVSVAARGGVAWMTSGSQLRRFDPDTGAAIGDPVPVGAGPIALGPDALWTPKLLPCDYQHDECEAVESVAERRDPSTGRVIETGGDIGALYGSHGAPDGALVATPGALWALSSSGRIVRRGVGGSVRAVAGERYTALVADGKGVVALTEDGTLAMVGPGGRVNRRRPVGPKYLSESRMAVSPRAVWVTSPAEGTLIRVAR